MKSLLTQNLNGFLIMLLSFQFAHDGIKWKSQETVAKSPCYRHFTNSNFFLLVGYSLFNNENLLYSIFNNIFYSKLDLNSTYQISFPDDGKNLYVFQLSDALILATRLLYGQSNAISNFQRVMDVKIHNNIEKIYAYID